MPSNKQNTRDQIILASLLHDIGKFWQRGDSKLEDSQNIVNPSQNWGWLVPYNDHNRPKYQHTIWTFQFIENHKSDFDKLGLWQTEEEKLSSLSAKHHLPDNYLQAIIQLADWWSSGIDRTQISIDDNTSALNIPPECIQDWGKISFKNLPLHSIFDTLKIKNKDGIYSINEKCHGYNLRALSLVKKDIFPYRISRDKVNEIKEKSLNNEYGKLWDSFNEEFELLPKGNISAFISSLTYLLKKYTWCIPSSTIDMPNVSLFEHLKTTAAIAGCLFEYGEYLQDAYRYEAKRISINKDHYPIRLCCIDLSGIQNFIYDISSSKAYKSLKGRSFYLQLLLDRILDFLLFELDQHHINIIYSSGGKAYFLLPNTDSIHKKTQNLLFKIEKMLWEEHKGKIFAAFGSVPFKYNFQKGSTGKVQSNYQFPNGKVITNLGDLWKAVSDLSSFQKTRKFKSLITKDFDAFFNENHQNSKIEQYPEVCEVTGQPFERDENNKLVSSNIGRDNEDNKISVLPSVKQQVDLGSELKDAKIIYSHPNNNQNRFNQKGKKSSFSFGEINKSILLLSEDPQELNSELNKWGTAVNSQFSTINSTDFLKSIVTPSSQAGSGFIFYGGNSQPEIKLKEYPTGISRPKTLEELCWLNDQKQIESENESYSKLGILRMDVDNLGQVFIHGFENENKSFAAYSTLSFQLDLFFSGYLNTIREKEKFKHSVAILYSGGDDIFAVGRWDKIIAFATEIRKELTEYLGRSDLSISAGIVIVDRKYPIYKAAELAKDAEDAAKLYKSSVLEMKNAISLFGETVSWNTEFEAVERLKTSLVDLTINQNLSHGLIHQLQRYKAIQDFNYSIESNPDQKRDFSYKWHSAYYLKRLQERYNKSPQIINLVEELKTRLLHDKIFGADRFLDLVGLAARWAEYEIRLHSKLKK